MSSANVLVIGATGKNGRALMDELAKRNIQARAFVRDKTRAESIAAMGFELAKGDLADITAIETALDGIERLYVVTAIRPDTEQLFANVFDSAKAKGVRHLVKFSGYGASETAPSEIIRQHGRTDDLLMRSGLVYTILRPNSFYQNLLPQAERIRSTGEFSMPIGNAKQSLVDIRDIAEATANILSQDGHENKIYNITGPEALSFNDVARTFTSVLGKPVRYVPMKKEDALKANLDAGVPEWNATALSDLQALFATGVYTDIEPDLGQILGHPARTFETFAEDHRGAFS